MHACQSFAAYFPQIGCRCHNFVGVVVLSRLSAFDLANMWFLKNVVFFLVVSSPNQFCLFMVVDDPGLGW